MLDEKSENSNDIVSKALKRFKIAEEAWKDVKDEALDDLEFRSGKQWKDDDLRDREKDGRPCLVINKIPQHIRQITNEQRQNRPSIKVLPVDDGADVETAKVIQGLVRHIERDSNAESVYDASFQGAATKGFGWFRIATEYESSNSFKQVIKIKKIKNDFLVLPDPNFTEIDGSDMNYCFVFEDIDKDEYKEMYGDTKLVTESKWESSDDQTKEWIKENTVRVAEYFYKDYENITLIQLSDGTSLIKEDIDSKEYSLIAKQGLITKERKSKRAIIKWAKINGCEVIEESVFPGEYIPVIPVLGDDLNINGKRIIESVIRHAKDPQRMYNYWTSTEAETIALAPRAPYLVAKDSIPDEYSKWWAVANKASLAYLPYEAYSKTGQALPPPNRNVFEPPIQATSNARMMASEDIKSTTGIYDAALGAKSNETSGVAIQGRQAQAQTSNYHFQDNFKYSLRHAGRIIVNLVPSIYDTAQAIRIIGEDDQQEIVKINELFSHNGKESFYDLSLGKYDIEVQTGPSYATKRQEALASMIDLTRSYPQVAQIAGDLMVKNMDWPGADEIAERLRKTLPPGIIDDKQGQQLPPQAQAQMQQMGQMIDQLTKQLNSANEQIKNKKYEIESKEKIEAMSLESRERIEVMKIEADLKKEMFKQNAQASAAILEQELAEINQRKQLLDINEDFDQESAEHFGASENSEQENQNNMQQNLTGEDKAPGQYIEEQNL